MVIAICVLAFCLVGCSGGDNTKNESAEKTSSEPIPLEIVNSGYTIEEYMKGSFTEQWGVLISNKNSDFGAQNIKLIITGRDKDNKVCGTTTAYLTALFANGEQAIGGSCFIDDAETLEFKIEESSDMWFETDLSQEDIDKVWYTTGVNDRTDSYGETTIGGEVVNESDSRLTMCGVNVLFLNEEGNIVAGAQTSVDTVSAHSSTPFSLSAYYIPKYSSVKTYVDTGIPEEE